jgi:DNA polymerase-3 subunit gamma/tau
LATTDPQKVSETIRSRVQHFQFHLIPLDQLEKYVRWVIEQAQLDVSDDAIEQVLQQGGGSARDTLSALEIVAAGGGDFDAPASIDEVFIALSTKDQARALAAIATAMQHGREARALTEDIVRSMRDAFLSLMAPELVQLPPQRTEQIAQLARDLGAQTIVRVMEVLGTTLIDMRNAPDPRLLLEVAMVKLSAPSFDDSFDNLVARIQQLEEALKTLKEKGVAASLPPAPRDPSTGRARVGGRAATPSPQKKTSDNTAPTAPPSQPADDTAPTPASAPPAAAETPAHTGGDPAQMWPQVIDSLTGFPKAIFKPSTVVSVEGTTVTVSVPSNTPMAKVEEHTAKLQAAIQKVCGAKYTLTFTQDPTASRGIERPAVVPNVADDLVDDGDLSDLEDSVEIPKVDSVDELFKAFPGGSVQDS